MDSSLSKVYVDEGDPFISNVKSNTTCSQLYGCCSETVERRPLMVILGNKGSPVSHVISTVGL